MVIISDTTTISNLFIIQKLWILQQLYKEIIIPTSVYDELLKLEGLGHNIDQLKLANWLKVQSLQNKDLFIILTDLIDRGEAEAIALAKELNADLLIIDETKGRHFAKKLNLQVIGLVGILLLAKQQLIIPNVKEVLLELKIKAGFWLSNEVYTMALSLARES
jgi:uncharacterized protein